MLSPLGIQVRVPADFGISLDVEETAPDFEGNAILKARALAARIGIPAIADDSGLEVDALNGEPGVRSARYGGEGLDDRGRCELLLSNLESVPEKDRTARFVSVIALVRDGEDSNPLVVRGEAPGMILNEFRGEEGFGYDPVFLDVESGKTFAELPGEKKDSISHRGRALEKFLEQIKSES